MKNRAELKSIDWRNNEVNSPSRHPTLDLNVRYFVTKMTYFTLLGDHLISAYDTLNANHQFDSLVSRNGSISILEIFAQDLIGFKKNIKNN